LQNVADGGEASRDSLLRLQTWRSSDFNAAKQIVSLGASVAAGLSLPGGSGLLDGPPVAYHLQRLHLVLLGTTLFHAKAELRVSVKASGLLLVRGEIEDVFAIDKSVVIVVGLRASVSVRRLPLKFSRLMLILQVLVLLHFL